MIRRKVQTIIAASSTALILCNAGSLAFAQPVAAGEASNSRVIINEIKLGGDAANDPSSSNEWITLFNAGGDAVDLVGWKLEYVKTSIDAETCDSNHWYNYDPGSPPKTVTELSGRLESHAVSTAISRQFNNDGFGAIHLVDASGHVQDLVGWDEGAPCNEGDDPASYPAPPKSLQRYLSCTDNFPVDTNDNAKDFVVSDTANPGGLSGKYATSCDNQGGSEEHGGATTCEGTIINELLPNPAGADTGREFIELYNPTNAAISLNGCALQISGSTTKTFHFAAADVLDPGEYRTWGDIATGLTLPNSAGGTVWLLSPEQDELQQVDYPAGLDDDVAWALFGSSWQRTYAPTPNAENSLLAELPCPAGQERNPDTSRCRNIVTTASTLVPCKPGQVRNPETHRCRSTSSAGSSSLKPCKPGQYRNPQTNRCRSLVSSENALKACKPGQVRNPATNRCKSTSSSGNSLKPCKAGWTRNPDTHRCRKSSDVKGDAINKVHDVASPIAHNAVGWLVAALAALCIIGYAAYEWRQEIRTYLTKLKTTGIHLRRNKR